jgi:hypothetical protein
MLPAEAFERLCRRDREAMRVENRPAGARARNALGAGL